MISKGFKLKGLNYFSVKVHKKYGIDKYSLSLHDRPSLVELRLLRRGHTKAGHIRGGCIIFPLESH